LFLPYYLLFVLYFIRALAKKIALLVISALACVSAKTKCAICAAGQPRTI
tara:strand:+ start:2595 stop:2744 length:150 start_codon:yes stop_codon:yes gene_type:complete